MLPGSEAFLHGSELSEWPAAAAPDQLPCLGSGCPLPPGCPAAGCCLMRSSLLPSLPCCLCHLRRRVQPQHPQHQGGGHRRWVGRCQGHWCCLLCGWKWPALVHQLSTSLRSALSCFPLQPRPATRGPRQPSTTRRSLWTRTSSCAMTPPRCRSWATCQPCQTLRCVCTRALLCVGLCLGGSTCTCSPGGGSCHV